ncbi:MAG: ROK family protein [Phycisphaerales bacterium]
MDASPVIGVDLGGTNMQVGVVDAQGRIVGRCKRKTKADLGLDEVVVRLVEAVERACTDAGLARREIASIGVGVPGAIDIPRGVVLEAPNLQWFDVPIRDILAREFDRPVVIDNDVNVAVWGEANVGAGRGRRDLLGVWVGTGVGGGLVLGGRIWHGPGFTAGEIGQTIATPDGNPSKRTLEQHASRTGIVHTLELLLLKFPDSRLHALRDENDGRIGSSQIAAAWSAGDQAAIEVVEHAASLIGVAIANVVTLLSIDAVVVGGGVTEAIGQPFVDRIRRSFDRDVFPARLRRCEIAMTTLGADAGVLGAALLARGS